MCVIVLVDSEARRPSNEMIELMWEKNGDGGGAAWREPQEDGEILVCWEKGLMKEGGLKRMKELAATLPIPHVLHMRIATSGGVKPSMCHPFPIDQRGQNTLTGKTKGFVLFHNGTAKDWEKEARQLAVTTAIPIPTGKWSDSRGLAWICSIIGNGYMELLGDQKGIAFGPEGEAIFAGSNGWEQVVDPATKEKIWCSNDHFLAQTGKNTYTANANNFGGGPYTVAPYCNGTRSCMRKDINADGKCPVHADREVRLLTASTDSASEVSPTPVPFPPTPRDDNQPQGPLLSLEMVERAYKNRTVPKQFMTSVKRAHERMRKGGKDGDRARRQLILCAMMPVFSGFVRQA